MAQDKNLTCRDCGKDFVFSTSEQQFYAEKRIHKMILSAVLTAGKQKNLNKIMAEDSAERKERCTTLFVLPAVSKRKFHFNQPWIDLFIAGNVIKVRDNYLLTASLRNFSGVLINSLRQPVEQK